MRAQGIGGVFLYSKDPEALAKWYAARFDLPLENWGKSWGCELPSADREPSDRMATTTFAVMPAKDDVSGFRVMTNWRISDFDAAIADLKAAGCTIDADDSHEYGRFARTTDPEGNGIEIWEPPIVSADG